MNKIWKLRAVQSSLLVASLISAGGAHAAAGFVALEGSDATAFHQDPQYTPQLFNYLQGASSSNVLVLGSVTINNTGSVGVTYVGSLSGVTLSNYSAIYIESPGGCCAADNTILNGFGAAVNAFIAAGGNLSIENYIGGGYDGVVPGGAAMPNGVVEGYQALNGGVGGGPSCTDGEVVTALGISKGFAQPPVDGCWSHQAYELSYWTGVGYQNLISSDTSFFFGDGTNAGSSFLAFGGTLGSSSVPEPGSLALLGLGLAGMLRRRGALQVE